MNCELCIEKLPRISVGVVHPFALSFEHLFDDVATTTFATATVGNVVGNGFDFGRSIGRSSSNATTSHHLIVGNIVAHIHHLFGFAVVFCEKLFPLHDFI